jgi:hypothetical protein
MCFTDEVAQNLMGLGYTVIGKNKGTGKKRRCKKLPRKRAVERERDGERP